MTFAAIHIILYVADQAHATAFYRRALDLSPRLDVPGMTEFQLTPTSVLGIMPAKSIKRLLVEAIDEPEPSTRKPQAELYLLVDDPVVYLARAVDAGARLLSPVADRDWGHLAGYCMDAEGNVLAFARAV